MKDLFQQFYDPILVSRQPDLAEFIEVEQETATKAAIEAKIKNSPIAKMISGDEIPKPLTLEEARAISAEIAKTKAAVAQTRSRIAGILSKIDESGLTSNSGQEISFNMNIAKKAQLKRAIKKVFGANMNTITYSMYRAAVNAKRALEKQETKEYVNEN